MKTTPILSIFLSATLGAMELLTPTVSCGQALPPAEGRASSASPHGR
jgi:hypothetical protein